MAIEKNTKNTLQLDESPFTTLINDVINNIKHTGALGVYCYLASKHSGWDICKKHLQNHFGCGREHIDTCFKYLKNIGAIQVTMVRDAKGRSIGWQTILKRKLCLETIDATQNTGNPVSGAESRIRVSQNLGKPESGKPASINKRSIEIKENIKTIGTSDEVSDFYYTQEVKMNDDSEQKQKSDYPSNHGITEKEVNFDLMTEGNSTKSDYFENQTKNNTISNLSIHYGLENLQEENIFSIPEQLIQDWLTNRKKKRAPLTKTAWNKINKELAKCKEQGVEPIDAFEKMVAHGWQALDAEWFSTERKGASSSQWDVDSVMRA